MPLFQPTAIFRGVEYITPEYLKQNGITALILDVDNTLTGHGSQILPEKVAEWIETMKQAGIGLVIASNNFEKRVAPFAKRIGLEHCALLQAFPAGAGARTQAHWRTQGEGSACGRPDFYRCAGGKPLRHHHAFGAADVPRRNVEPAFQTCAGSTHFKKVL